jgi:hypothetical protein
VSILMFLDRTWEDNFIYWGTSSSQNTKFHQDLLSSFRDVTHGETGMTPSSCFNFIHFMPRTQFPVSCYPKINFLYIHATH